jgi:hypothetical protein
MAKRVQAWQVLVGVILLCCGMIWLMSRWRLRENSLSAWQSAFPKSVHTFLYIDVAALNQADLLSRLAPPGKVDAEYARFVEESAFDYQRDLRSVLMGFDSQSSYVLASGAFDWPSLTNYATTRNGSCRFSVCRISGSASDRSVSYGPYGTDTLAFSSGPDQWAVLQLLGSEKLKRPPAMLRGPIWLSTSGAALRTATSIPDGARAYAAILEPASRIELAIAPRLSAGDLSVALRAECPDPLTAQRVARDLGVLTSALRDMLAKEKKSPNANEFANLLAGGSFQAEGTRVDGKWPLSRPFLEQLITSSAP